MVTAEVPDYALMMGVPARRVGWDVLLRRAPARPGPGTFVRFLRQTEYLIEGERCFDVTRPKAVAAAKNSGVALDCTVVAG